MSNDVFVYDVEEWAELVQYSAGNVSQAIQGSGQDNREGVGDYKQVKMSTKAYDCHTPSEKKDKDEDYSATGAQYEIGRHGLPIAGAYAYAAGAAAAALRSTAGQGARAARQGPKGAAGSMGLGGLGEIGGKAGKAIGSAGEAIGKVMGPAGKVMNKAGKIGQGIAKGIKDVGSIGASS